MINERDCIYLMLVNRTAGLMIGLLVTTIIFRFVS